MQFGECGDIVHHIIGIAQGGEALAHHAGAHHFVMVEGDSAFALISTRLGLADVVEQCGQSQHDVGFGGWRMRCLQVNRLLHHGERVLVDVLVPMVLIDLELQAGQLRQDVRRQPRLDEDSKAQTWACSEQELGQLVADALRGDDLQPRGHIAHRHQHLGVNREAELGDEAGRPHHAKGIVTEGLLRLDGRAQ